jgi:hypothetical protein
MHFRMQRTTRADIGSCLIQSQFLATPLRSQSMKIVVFSSLEMALLINRIVQTCLKSAPRDLQKKKSVDIWETRGRATGVLLFGVGSSIMMALTISLNTLMRDLRPIVSSSESVWSFGQILALLTTMVVAIQFWVYARGRSQVDPEHSRRHDYWLSKGIFY